MLQCLLHAYLFIYLSLCLLVSLSLCLSLSICTSACFRSSACLAVRVKSVQTGLQLAAVLDQQPALGGRRKYLYLYVLFVQYVVPWERESLLQDSHQEGKVLPLQRPVSYVCTYHVCCMLAACTSVSRSCCLSVLLSVGPCLLSVSLALWLSLSICTDLVCLFACCMSVCMSA